MKEGQEYTAKRLGTLYDEVFSILEDACFGLHFLDTYEGSELDKVTDEIWDTLVNFRDTLEEQIDAFEEATKEEE